MVVLISCVMQKSKPGESGNEVMLPNEYQQYLFKAFKYEYVVACLHYGYNPDDRKFLENDYSFAHGFSKRHGRVVIFPKVEKITYPGKMKHFPLFVRYECG